MNCFSHKPFKEIMEMCQPEIDGILTEMMERAKVHTEILQKN